MPEEEAGVYTPPGERQALVDREAEEPAMEQQEPLILEAVVVERLLMPVAVEVAALEL